MIIYVESWYILTCDGCVLEEHFQADIPFEPVNGLLEVVGWIILL